jgi:hypothetical protein
VQSDVGKVVLGGVMLVGAAALTIATAGVAAPILAGASVTTGTLITGAAVATVQTGFAVAEGYATYYRTGSVADAVWSAGSTSLDTAKTAAKIMPFAVLSPIATGLTFTAIGAYSTANSFQQLECVKNDPYATEGEITAAKIEAGMSLTATVMSALFTAKSIHDSAQIRAAQKSGGTDAAKTYDNTAQNADGVFPENPDDFLPEIPRETVVKPNGTRSQIIQTSDKIRIRAEEHPLLEGETYNPRHHGVHYHVETRVDSSVSWNNRNNVIKIHPEGYHSGGGTGFIPGEKYPGWK